MSERIVGSARLWGISVSFGCINSLISMPCLMSYVPRLPYSAHRVLTWTGQNRHASIDPAVRKARNLPEDLIRLCVGIEDPEDLIDDLEAALLEAGAVRVIDEAGERAKLERVREGGAGTVELANSANGQGEVEGEAKIKRLITSAPGKVILFGEHAVVHGVVRSILPLFADSATDLFFWHQTAIASSIDLRCYTLATSRSDGMISLDLPDLSYNQSWEISSLPWEKIRSSSQKAPRSDESPDQELLTLLANSYVKPDVLKAVQAAQAFLYLYMHLCGSSRYVSSHRSHLSSPPSILTHFGTAPLKHTPFDPPSPSRPDLVLRPPSPSQSLLPSSTLMVSSLLPRPNRTSLANTRTSSMRGLSSPRKSFTVPRAVSIIPLLRWEVLLRSGKL